MEFVKFVISDVQNVSAHLQIVLHVQLIDSYIMEHAGIIAQELWLIINVSVNALQVTTKSIVNSANNVINNVVLVKIIQHA